MTKGAIASSAVVNAILDFVEFDEQVAESVGPKCANILRETTAQVEKLILSGGQVAQQTKELFGVRNFSSHFMNTQGRHQGIHSDCRWRFLLHVSGLYG
jgi:hypothetical protein